MPKTVLIDEFHVGLFVPRGLPKAEYDAIHRTLDEPRFHVELRRVIREVVRRHPILCQVRARLTR